MTLFFEVPGEPVGKARPRFTRQGHAYTPKKTSDYEREVRNSFRIAYPAHEPMAGPVSMEVYAFFGVPKSWPMKKREAALRSESLLPTGRPDASNVLKAVEDALNGLAYLDDSQIVDASVQKRYASRPRVEVSLVMGRERCPATRSAVRRAEGRKTAS
jgi:Holliday junction resolvase RusA-like endonuclease